MGMNFPDVPTNGQISGPYTWDGEKWIVTPTGGSTPSNSSPIMDSVAAPGVSALYSRGDHVHPSDTAKVAKAGDTMGGDLTIMHAGSSSLSLIGGNAAASGATLQMHKTGVNKWFIGHDSAVLGSGTSDDLVFYSAGYNVTLRLAYTGGAVSVSGGLVVGDNGIHTGTGGITSDGPVASKNNFVAGSATVSGAYYFGSSGTKYLNYDGTNYQLAGGGLAVLGYVNVGANAGSGTIYFGNTGSRTLTWDGTSFSLTYGTGSLILNNGGAGNSSASLVMDGGSAVSGGCFTQWRKNGVIQYSFGHSSTFFATTSNDLVLYNHMIPASVMQVTAANNSTQFYYSLLVGNAPMTAPAQIAKFAYGGGSTQYGIGMRPQADTTTVMWFENAGGTNIGSISQTATNVAFNTASSAELKEDLKSFDAGNIIDQTNVYDFKWKSSSERAYGVIAQQAIEVYPLAVTHSKQDGMDDDAWGVDYSKYIPVLLQELKTLRARVAQLEGRVDAKPGQ